MTTESFFAGATGYDPYEHFFASCYRQGGRTVYALDWSVRELVTFLPKPDPDKPLDTASTQRRIVPGHARSFGDYIVTDPSWVSPALLLRAPGIFKYEPAPAGVVSDTTSFGRLGVPKDSRAEIQIVDGQHRTLGFHLGWEQLTKRISDARQHLARAKGLEDAAVIAQAEKELTKVIQRRDQLANERVSVQIIIVDTPEVARRVFVDINDNAKGITGAVKSRFDDRKVISRALNRVLETNDLLESRVDLEQDRVSGSSKYLLGAKHVADILRSLTVGHGRVGKRVEDEADEQEIARTFDTFTVALQTAFPLLDDLENGKITPAELRKQHLIGSNVLLRAFAAAWWELRNAKWTPEDIATRFATFDAHMSAPVYADSDDTWYRTGVFAPRLEGAASPTSRIQDFKTLSDFIVTTTKAGDAAKWHRASQSDPALLPQ